MIFPAEISFVCVSARQAANRQEEEVRQTSPRDTSSIPQAAVSEARSASVTCNTAAPTARVAFYICANRVQHDTHHDCELALSREQGAPEPLRGAPELTSQTGCVSSSFGFWRAVLQNQQERRDRCTACFPRLVVMSGHSNTCSYIRQCNRCLEFWGGV